MDSVDKPKYKIGQNVIFKYGSGKAMGKIKSAISSNEARKWLYVISNPQNPGNLYIPQSDIINIV